VLEETLAASTSIWVVIGQDKAQTLISGPLWLLLSGPDQVRNMMPSGLHLLSH